MKDAAEMQAIIEIMAGAAVAEDENWMRSVPARDREKWKPKEVARLQASGILAALAKAGYTISRKH